MQGEPIQSGYVSRFCGEAWHDHFCVLWPRRQEAEARIDFFDDEESFRALMKKGPNGGLEGFQYMYVDEFSRVGIKPAGDGGHILELLRRGKTGQQPTVYLKLQTRQSWTGWMENIYSVLCANQTEGLRSGNACLDSFEKLGKGGEKQSVTMSETTLSESLGLAGDSGTLYIIPTGVVFKANKTGRTISWHYSIIRRYRSKGEVMTIEVGRRAETGAGIVQFVTKKAGDIVAKIAKASEAFLVRCAEASKNRAIENDYVKQSVVSSRGIPAPCQSEYEDLGYIMAGDSLGRSDNHYATLNKC